MAQDLTLKRQQMIATGIKASMQLVDALNVLLQLKEERSKLSQDFQDADFSAQGLGHCTPGMMGTLFDFVVTSLVDNYVDVENGGRNKQILLQVRQ